MTDAAKTIETIASLNARIRAIGGDIAELLRQRQDLERQRDLLIADGKNSLPDRWIIAWHEDGPRLESPTGSCRDHDCCGGATCGWTLAEAMAQIVRHYEDQKTYWSSPVNVLVSSGYDPKDYDFTGIAESPMRAAG